MTEYLISEKVLVASNLLDQIERVNEMINLHRSNGNGNSFSVTQYELIKYQFIQELQEVLSNNFQVKANLEALVA